MQDRYRGGGGGRQGGSGGAGGGGGQYGGGGGRRRRGRGGGRRPDIFPNVAIDVDEHPSPWIDDFDREPNPDAEPLHQAYDSVYTHEGDVREELLEAWVEASQNGKRWRCWNCGRTTQRFTQLRLPTLRTVVSMCDNCNTWTVWDAWRDLANPRIFNFRRTIEESEPAATREVGPSSPDVTPAVRSNGSGAAHAFPPRAPSPPPRIDPGVAEPPRPAPVESASQPQTPEPSPQPSASLGEVRTEEGAKPKRTRAPRAKASAAGEIVASPAPADEPTAKPKRTRAKKTTEAPQAESHPSPPGEERNSD